LSVKESLGQSLREGLGGKWTKYVIASALIHGAVLSVPFPFMVPHMTGPIDVLILEGSGAASPSGGSGRQDRPRVRTRREMPRPTAREEVRIRPRETLRPAEHKAEPIQAVAENIPAKAPAARNDPAAVPQTETGVTAGGGREKAAPGSGGTGAAGGPGRGAATGAADIGFGSPDGPRFLHREIPEYPFLARKRKIEGRVVLAVVIDATGRLTRVDVIEASDRSFVEASLEALKKSTFLPARRNGRPVTSRALLPIRFSLIE